MLCIEDRNLHEALPTMCKLLTKRGYKIADDKVLRLDGPLSIKIMKPIERVSFHSDLVMDPFAFFFAGMQMLFANVKGLQEFGKMLREDKVGMAFVVNILDTYAVFQRNRERDLDVFVTGRSSDPIQDTIVTSMMQEVMAHLADCPVGSLTWQSTNVHIDIERAGESCEKVAAEIDKGSPYAAGDVKPHKIIDIPMNRWLRELDTFSKQQHRGTYTELFFSNVVTPLYQAGISLKEGMFGQAQAQLDACFATDWRKACYNWTISQSLRTQ